MCIFYQTFNKGVHMHMSLYTSMSYTQIEVYYLLFHNEIFVNNLLISNYYVIYLIIMNYLIKLNYKIFIWIH